MVSCSRIRYHQFWLPHPLSLLCNSAALLIIKVIIEKRQFGCFTCFPEEETAAQPLLPSEHVLCEDSLKVCELTSKQRRQHRSQAPQRRHSWNKPQEVIKFRGKLSFHVPIVYMYIYVYLFIYLFHFDSKCLEEQQQTHCADFTVFSL